MKKSTLFLAIMLLLLLCSCGDSSETDADYIALSGTVSSVSEHELMIDVT